MLNLYLVGQHKVLGPAELKPDANALVFGADQSKSAGLFYKFCDAFNPLFAFSAGYKIAQVPDDRP